MAELKTLSTIDTSPFKRLVLNLGATPTAFTEGMTYYELLAWLVKFLEEEVIPKTNENIEAVKELQTYVSTYFDSLDVQEEINNKLDQMAESGELENIIAAYLNTTAIFGYDNITALKTATNITNEGYAITYGFYQLNDGGGAKYKIREITNADVVDEKFIISLANENLIAELIIENSELNMLSIGAKHEDNTFDNTSILLAAIAKANESKLITKIFYPAGTYTFLNSVDLANNDLNLQSIEIYGANTTEPGNESSTIFSYAGNNYFMVIDDAFNSKIHDLFIQGNLNNKGIYGENTFWTDFYNLYFRRFTVDITLDGYNAYDHITNSTFVINQSGFIGVVIGGEDSTYPRNYTEYIWIEKNHFEQGATDSIGIKTYAAFFLYIVENDFSNTTSKAIDLDARSTVAHNIQDVFIESNSFAKTKTCVEIHGGISGSSVTKIKIDGDYNNSNNENGYKILNAVRGTSGGYLGYVTVEGMVNDFIASEKWITLDNCSETVINVNNINQRNIEVLSGAKPKLVFKTLFDSNIIYENFSEGVTATVSGNVITYDFSTALPDLAAGLVIISGAVSGTNNSCVFSATINRGTRYGSDLIYGKGSNITSITTNGRNLVVTCNGFTPSANVGDVKFTLIR